MLLNNIFTIVSKEVAPGTLKFVISLNSVHKIFSGHFPGLPVLPGVCMLQIVKELFELSQLHPYHLAFADNIKFLAVLNPTEHNQIDVLISFDEVKTGSVAVQASLFCGSVTFFRMKATFQPAT